MTERQVLCTIIDPEPKEKTKGKQKITTVSFDEFANYEFIPPATFFIQNAMGEYIFIHTANRATAQFWVDENYGKGRYTVKASKLQKGKELGEGSKPAFGTATRKGQRK